MEYSNGAAEYRYHGTYGDANGFGQAAGMAANAFCASVPSGEAYPGQSGTMMPIRRFHPYEQQGHANGAVVNGNGDFGHYGANHQCDQCGAVYDSPHALAEHVQTQHPFGNFPDYANPPLTKSETNEAAEILDLDSHKVHVYQPPGALVNHNQVLAPTPPYTPATSVGSGSNCSSMGWMTPTPPLVPQQQTHEYRAQPHAPNNGLNAYPNYEMMSPVSQNNAPPMMTKSHGTWKSSTSTNHGGSEARRPKTYNCEACNKWFTSSGHLKRHYNTTLHKNAIKTSGSSNGASSGGENGRRSATPSSRSTPGAVASPTGSDEPKLDDAQPSPKPVASPGQVEYRPAQHPLPGAAPTPVAPSAPAYQPNPNYGLVNGTPLAPPQPLDPYRTSFNMGPNSAPVGSYYCPPGAAVGRPGGPGPGPGHGYPGPPVAYPMQQGQQQQQQHPQQHHYQAANPMNYPPNPIAPPLSSNGQSVAPGVGPIASRGLQQQAILQQQQQQYHPLQTAVFNNNNMERHLKEDELIKMDVMNGGGDLSSPSEDSPDGSDLIDASDASDAESVETKNRLKAPTLNSTPKRTGPITNGTDGVGTFKCQQCDKAFNRVCYLTQHNNTFHKGDKPFKCHMCGKRFQNAELFSQHQQKHAGDKPYKCPLCPKQFNHKTDLRRHMCLHTGQKPFMCQVCSKGFIRKDHMVKHVQTHTRRNALHASNATPTAPSL